MSSDLICRLAFGPLRSTVLLPLPAWGSTSPISLTPGPAVSVALKLRVPRAAGARPRAPAAAWAAGPGPARAPGAFEGGVVAPAGGARAGPTAAAGAPRAP